MKPSLRNLAGVFILITGLSLYALLVMQLGARIAHWPILIQTPFYLAAGLIWLWPARKLLYWMGKAKDRENGSP